jgi:hypothetical protein
MVDLARGLNPGRSPPGAAVGEILGPVVSPVAAARGQAVACGRGAVVLLEVEDAQGRIPKIIPFRIAAPLQAVGKPGWGPSP